MKLFARRAKMRPQEQAISAGPATGGPIPGPKPGDPPIPQRPGCVQPPAAVPRAAAESPFNFVDATLHIGDTVVPVTDVTIDMELQRPEPDARIQWLLQQRYGPPPPTEPAVPAVSWYAPTEPRATTVFSKALTKRRFEAWASDSECGCFPQYIVCRCGRRS